MERQGVTEVICPSFVVAKLNRYKPVINTGIQVKEVERWKGVTEVICPASVVAIYGAATPKTPVFSET